MRLRITSLNSFLTLSMLALVVASCGDDNDSTAMPPDAGPADELLADGEPCSDSDQCQGLCQEGPSGGVCGECIDDADCTTGGCTSAFGEGSGSTCNSGALGDQCQTTDVCMSPFSCEAGLASASFDVRGCSACAQTSDCTGSDICRPIVSLDSGLSGYRDCAAPASVPLGGSCELGAVGGPGDQVCASGVCEPVSIRGAVTYGVCSECRDGDCAAGQVCAPASVNLDDFTVTPRLCASAP